MVDRQAIFYRHYHPTVVRSERELRVYDAVTGVPEMFRPFAC
jgi:hypothetical protein